MISEKDRKIGPPAFLEWFKTFKDFSNGNVSVHAAIVYQADDFVVWRAWHEQPNGNMYNFRNFAFLGTVGISCNYGFSPYRFVNVSHETALKVVRQFLRKLRNHLRIYPPKDCFVNDEGEFCTYSSRGRLSTNQERDLLYKQLSEVEGKICKILGLDN